MLRRVLKLSIGLIMLLASGVACWATPQATPSSTVDTAAIEQVVRNLLKQHPEIVVQAAQDAQAQEAQRAQQELASLAQSHLPELLNTLADPSLGPQGAPVTVVEFIDYQCHFCQAENSKVLNLVATDRRVRVVVKVLDVFGTVSEEAAKIAIASKKIGKFEAIHQAFFALPAPVTDATLRKAASDNGMDRAAVDAALKDPENAKIVASNMALAKAIKLTGTPTFIVGRDAIVGAVDEQVIKNAIDNATKTPHS